MARGSSRAARWRALARARREDIEAALGALEPAARAAGARVSGDFRSAPEVQAAHFAGRSAGFDWRRWWRLRSARCPEVEFSAEDSSRSDLDFLAQAFTIAADAGATILNVPDTVGYTTPEEYGGDVSHAAGAAGRPAGPGVERALPQRPGAGGGEFAGGGGGGRAAGGVRHQRHRRARGQRGAGRDCRGAGGAPRSLPGGDAVCT